MGERLISGGFDYQLKMWDFPTMDKSVQYHRAISPCESHQLRSIEFSPGNDMLLIASGSCQGKVINRDGEWRICERKGASRFVFDFLFRKEYLWMYSRWYVSGWYAEDQRSHQYVESCLLESERFECKWTFEWKRRDHPSSSSGIHDLFRRWNCSSLVSDPSDWTCLMHQNEIWTRKENGDHHLYLQHLSHAQDPEWIFDHGRMWWWKYSDLGSTSTVRQCHLHGSTCSRGRELGHGSPLVVRWTTLGIALHRSHVEVMGHQEIQTTPVRVQWLAQSILDDGHRLLSGRSLRGHWNIHSEENTGECRRSDQCRLTLLLQSKQSRSARRSSASERHGQCRSNTLAHEIESNYVHHQ